MAVKIRLRQQGRNNRRVFRLVAADTRSPRDGKYLETLGWYNPHEQQMEKQLFIDTAKLQKWMENGAILSPKAQALVAKVAPSVIHDLKAKTHAHKEQRAQKRRKRRNAPASKAKVAPTKKAAAAKSTSKVTPKTEKKTVSAAEKKPATRTKKDAAHKANDKTSAKAEGSK